MSGEVGRPGTGGRQPMASPHTTTSATHELYEQFGAPLAATSMGVTMLSWVEDPDGEGIIFARLSGRDLQRGETAMLQIHPGRSLMAAHGLRARLLIVTTDNTGAREYARRPDFAAVEQAHAQGWLRWVCWRDQERIAREPMPFEQFMRHALDAQIDVYLHGLGRRVEWATDRLMLRTLGVVSAEEREKIAERTHRALRERWLKEGRGWPSARKFGFRRNPVTKYLEVDPEQWEFVKRIHLRYAELEQRPEGRGVAALATELTKLGCELSPAQLRRILRDRIYVDGVWSVNDGKYPGRPIHLDEPIPEAIYERNQELLSLCRGRSSRTAIGEFALSGVPVVHSACEHLRDSADRPPTLLGRRHRDRQGLAYRHAPWVPEPCRGFSIPRDHLDDAVTAALVDLSEHPALESAWQRACRPDLGVIPPVISENDERTLRLRISRIQRQLGRVRRLHREALVDGGTLDLALHRDLIDDLASEIARCEARLRSRSIVPEIREQTHAEPASLRDALSSALRQSDAVTRAALIQRLTRAIRVSDRHGREVAIEIESYFGLLHSATPDTRRAEPRDTPGGCERP